MNASRRQVLAACALVAAAIAWALWPSRPSRKQPQAPAVPERAASGPLGSAVRDAVVQSGAPGTTPPVETAPAAGDGVLEVRVFARGRPADGAHVRAYLRGLPDRNTAQVEWRFAGAADTGAGGFARIPARPGAYLVAARSGTFAPARAEVRRPAGEPVTRLSLELLPAVSVSGRTVQKGTREPVPLALVTFTPGGGFARPSAPPEEQARATSDAQGRFRVDGLAPARYAAAAQATGYARGSALVDAASAREVTLELPQASFIEGRVLAADGSPAAGAEVTASGGEDAVTAAATGTGSFSLEVPPRTWEVTARRAGQAGRAPSPVSVAAGATFGDVVIRLGPPSGISGVVVAAGSQKPVQGAQVAVSPHGANGDSGRAATGPSGEFAVAGLPPGSYDVVVSADGYTDASRRGVTVEPGQRFPLRIEVRQTGAVEGVVRDGAGRGVAFALVRVLRQRFGVPTPESRADESGAYRLSGVEAGRGEFVALREGSALGITASATVPEGGAARLDFRLEDEGVVAGRVRRKDGSLPPADASVTAMSASGGGWAAVPVDAAGAYAASLPAGPYTLTTGARWSRAAVFVTVEAGRTATQDLVYAEAQDDAQGFSGTVLEPGGAPSAGASVRGLTGARAVFFAGADESGRFHSNRARADLPDSFEVFAVNGGRTGRVAVAPEQEEAVVRLQPAATLRGHLADGPAAAFRVELSPDLANPGLSLEFTGDRFELRDAPGVPSHLVVTTADGRSASLEVPLSPGAVQEVEVSLQPLADVSGRVVDAATREPLADVSLWVESGADLQEAATGADGTFHLRLAAGRRTLRASSPRYAGLSSALTVVAGQPLQLGDLAMTRRTASPGTIGASLRGDSDTPPTVVWLLPDGPADRAGLHLGDQIALVDGEPVSAVSDAIRRIRGAPGTPVQLSVRRGGMAMGFTVTRAR